MRKGSVIAKRARDYELKLKMFEQKAEERRYEAEERRREAEERRQEAEERRRDSQIQQAQVMAFLKIVTQNMSRQE